MLARFLAGALPTLMQQLAIAAPRSEVERLLNELLHTMRFSGPLPSFKVRWASCGVLTPGRAQGCAAVCLPFEPGVVAGSGCAAVGH